MTSPSPLAKAASILPVLALSAASLAFELSGRMVNLDSTAKAGVSVALKRGGLVVASTETGTDGAWTLAGAFTGVVSRQHAIERRNGRIDLRSGRLAVVFEGRDLAGHSRGGDDAMIRSAAAARSMDVSVPDTIVYSIGGKVVLRDTISDTVRVGMGRFFDTTWNASIVYGYLTDPRDGRFYRTVKIGTQVWMAQNLDFRRDTSWVNRDSLELERRYGRLYQWTAVMDTLGKFNDLLAGFELPRRGICPSGWHVPSDAEWSVLIKLVDSANSGTALKALEFPAQAGVDTAKDAWGFRVMPGGQTAWLTTVSPNRYVYRAFGTNGLFWTASEVNDAKAYVRNFGQNLNNSSRMLYPKNEGCSLRCLAD